MHSEVFVMKLTSLENEDDKGGEKGLVMTQQEPTTQPDHVVP